MVAGRPPIYNRDEMADKMLEWVKQPTSFNLCGFAAQEMIPPSYLLAWSKEPGSKFSTTYEIVKSLLGEKREKALLEGKVHVKAYDLNAAVYDPFLRDERMSQVQHDAEARRKSEVQVSGSLELQSLFGFADNQSKDLI